LFCRRIPRQNARLKDRGLPVNRKRGEVISYNGEQNGIIFICKAINMEGADDRKVMAVENFKKEDCR
jgi:hypothetical protein